MGEQAEADEEQEKGIDTSELHGDCGCEGERREGRLELGEGELDVLKFEGCARHLLYTFLKP